MLNLHSLVKFWARKDPKFISQEISGARLIADPFCGSGSSGFSAVLNNVSALLSDINPVSVFITYNILNKETLEFDTLKVVENVCNEIEEEVYTLSNSKKVNFAVWKTSYKCPFCAKSVNLMPRTTTRCKDCNRTFSTRDMIINDNVISLKFITGESTQDKELIKEYLKIEENLKIKWWYPKGKFVYPGTEIEFRDGPHRPIEIKDLFTKRNLYVASRLYSYIEKIWRTDQVQGDLLKLVFIASLANATKMIPHAKSSGPSWKVPRYWIPSLREERNFCRAFLRRLLLLYSFKEKWLTIASKYQITVSFTGEIITPEKRSIHICRADAFDICSELPKSDLIILDPPHYDEINYFELTYLWQKWLEGDYNDERFKYYDYWNKEICLNRKIGKDLQWYTRKLYELLLCYVNRLRKGGKAILILHNKDENLLKRTVSEVRDIVGNDFAFTTTYIFPRIPSSTQGLHGHRKYLCIVKIKRTS